MRNKIIIFIVRLILSACIMMITFLLLRIIWASPIELPINGIHPKLDLDEHGQAHMIYFPGPIDRQIRYHDLQTGLDEQVPGSTNRFLWSWDIMYAGIGAGYGRVGVSWCVDNTDIWYAEKDLSTGQWTEYHSIYHGSGVNRTDIDVGPYGIMVLIQGDDKMFSLYKPHGGLFNAQQFHYEKGHPRLEYAAGSWYGTVNKSQKQWVMKHNGDAWEVLHAFVLAGYPDSPGFYVSPQGDFYVTGLLWTGVEHYTGIYVGFGIGGVYHEEYIYSGDIAGNDTHPPGSVVAVDTVGNIVVGWGFDWDGDCGSRTMVERLGQWGLSQQVGDSNFIALDYFDPWFHAVYNKGGHFWYDRFSLTNEPTPTPTQGTTPTAVATATSTPTSTVETPTVGTTPTPTYTPVPTNTPGVCPTPVCQYQWGNQGICCTWQSTLMLFGLLCGLAARRVR